MPRTLACLLLLGLSCTLSSAAASPAGEIAALKPAATRNAQPATLRQEVDWNDVLATGPSGRLRAALADGSQLSLGSSSHLTVTAHDPRSQQTQLQLLYGRLRSRVVPLTQPGSKFEVKTSAAAIGVIGTDFYVAAGAQLTTVICYRGTVTVTGTGRDRRTVTVHEGQVVEVTPDAVGLPQQAAAELLRQTLALTSVGDLLDLPQGTAISALLDKSLDSRKAKVGDMVTARVAQAVKLSGEAVLPRGSRLLGRVDQVQARRKQIRESRLAFVFDSVRLRGGEEVMLSVALQALAPPPPGPALADQSSPFPAETAGSAASPAPVGATGAGPAPGGVLGGTVSRAGSTVGTAAGAAGNVPAPEVRTAASTAAGGGLSLPALAAGGRLTAASQGAVNLPGLSLAVSATGGAVLSSSTRDVHLESGTQLLLRTAAPPPSAGKQ